MLRPETVRTQSARPIFRPARSTAVTGVNAEFLPRETPFDLVESQRLLTEAGYPNGIDLSAIVLCPSFAQEPRIMAIVAESLRTAGINVEIRKLPCDGFNDYVLAVNEPVGRLRRNLVGPRNPAINMGRLVTDLSTENGGWTGPAGGGDGAAESAILADGARDRRRATGRTCAPS